ncbi:MAG TPA: DUF5947 family protein [Bryobacteraceae bacterium]|jgi:hypothetical protein
MSAPPPFLTLRRFVPAKNGVERCDLCGVPLPPEHPHLLEVSARRLVCACDACSILFCHRAASTYRRVGRNVRVLDQFQMSDVEWESLLLPIGLAFFVYNTPAARVMAFYPSPAGPAESLLTLESWSEIAARNTVLQEMEPDVEALLVNRIGEAREYYMAPIDRCYHLVGLIRTKWTGLSGGDEVWEGIARFFADLRESGTVTLPESVR